MVAVYAGFPAVSGRRGAGVLERGSADPARSAAGGVPGVSRPVVGVRHRAERVADSGAVRRRHGAGGPPAVADGTVLRRAVLQAAFWPADPRRVDRRRSLARLPGCRRRRAGLDRGLGGGVRRGDVAGVPERRGGLGRCLRGPRDLHGRVDQSVRRAVGGRRQPGSGVRGARFGDPAGGLRGGACVAARRGAVADSRGGAADGDAHRGAGADVLRPDAGVCGAGLAQSRRRRHRLAKVADGGGVSGTVAVGQPVDRIALDGGIRDRVAGLRPEYRGGVAGAFDAALRSGARRNEPA
jgi:hypothetical protein